MNIKTIKPNLTEVTSQNAIVVFSYNTPVIVRDLTNPGVNWYVTDKKHSNTTTRHIKHYLTEVYAMREGDWQTVSQSMINQLAGHLA